MQWNLIFEHESVSPLLGRLNDLEKTLLIACYLYRQVRLLRRFDNVYATDLSSLFLRSLDVALSGHRASVEAIERVVSSRIPDTEEYTEQEGAYAQNLVIALDYFLLFLLEVDEAKLQSCINMALQNLDLLNFEADEGYDEVKVTMGEIAVVSGLVADILSLRPSLDRGVDLLEGLVSGYKI
ncbi:hypothetical protein GIW26_19800 [Pseudomonas syringae]|uniref:hypothetical protein n=1 Tax=Pseudomonas syringae TaxID=317 RepID=UPI000C07F24C|nr:hypothetical protein [Pseudomonas syringae]MCF8985803.1 hypothetical protein [Pseudomonas syringae]PHN47160.1 hypothetical protein AO254_02310 [Pseudomonas syringae]